MSGANGQVIEDLERTALAFSLASLSSSYPTEGFAARMELLLTAAEGLAGDFPLVSSALDAEAVSQLESEYIDLFDRRSGGVPLCETEFGRGRAMAKGSELADISGFYRAFGLDVDGGDGPREMADHLSVELEFYAWLLLKQAHLLGLGDAEGESVVLDARRKFLRDHLGPFAAALAARPELEAAPAYGAILWWAAGLVAKECQRLEVVAEPKALFLEEAEADAVECGMSPKGVSVPGAVRPRLSVID